MTSEVDHFNKLPFPTSKFKNHIMEKYLRGLDNAEYPTTITFDTNNNTFRAQINDDPGAYTGPELSKWLESAAKFTPSRDNYIDWYATKSDKLRESDLSPDQIANLHQKEEIEAAEALTKLALNFRNRFGV